MPEVPICIWCRKPINKENDNYVVVNRDIARYDSEWLYAHPECQEKNAGKPIPRVR
jgi:hypothetical protein